MIDKPTIEKYYPNDTISYQSWKKNGKFHRLNELPAVIYYYENGSIRYQAWWENDKRHRSNGLPAWVCYHKNGNIKYQEYWENGNYISRKQVLKRQYKFFNKIMDSIDKEEGIDL